MIEKKVVDFLRKNSVFKDTSKLLVAMSGGRDSMCLFHLLYKEGYRVDVAHVNYQLRGKESERDQQLTQNIASELQVEYHLLLADLSEISKSNTKSIQEEARNVRYDWFEKLARTHQYTHILTAHHADDQAETMLYQFIKGAGLNGLKGIPEVRGNVLRPLIECSRIEIDQYCEKNQITYTDDLSNFTNKYNRNKIRNRIIPAIHQINPGFTETMRIHSNLYRSLDNILKADSTKYIAKNSSIDKGVHVLSICEDWINTDLPARLHYLLSFAELNRDQLKNIGLALESNTKGALFDTPHHRLCVHGSEIHWLKKDELKKAEKRIVSIREYGMYLFGRFVFELTENPAPYDDSNTDSIVLSGEIFSLHLRLKTWSEGECFLPQGMQTGRKKLSDYLNEKKFSVLQKAIYPILYAGDQVLWIPQYRKSRLACSMSNKKTEKTWLLKLVQSEE